MRQCARKPASSRSATQPKLSLAARSSATFISRAPREKRRAPRGPPSLFLLILVHVVYRNRTRRAKNPICTYCFEKIIKKRKEKNSTATGSNNFKKKKKRSAKEKKRKKSKTIHAYDKSTGKNKKIEEEEAEEERRQIKRTYRYI